MVLAVLKIRLLVVLEAVLGRHELKALEQQTKVTVEALTVPGLLSEKHVSALVAAQVL